MSNKNRARKSVVTRTTKETRITVKLNIDGTGKSKIDTGIGILDHMLQLFAYWGFFDLEIQAKGDLNIDIHHTNEDIGIVLGQAFEKALGKKIGITRQGFFAVPMEDVMSTICVDICGRAYYKLARNFGDPLTDAKEGYDFEYAEQFLDAFAKNARMNLFIHLHIDLSTSTASRDVHVILEPTFKALGKVLDQATQIDPRRRGIPSTKGVID